MSEWISVSDALPENPEESVLMINNFGTQYVGAYFDGRWHDWNGPIGGDRFIGKIKLKPIFITHWMPLPEPPKEAA